MERMIRRGIAPLFAMMLVFGIGLVGCGGSNTSTTTTTAAGGGATVTTAKPSGTTTGTATTGSAAAANTINIVVNDTQGLNGPMTMKVSPESAKAGKVTFVVKNTGTIVHEVVVLQLSSGQTWDKLPVTEDKVSEDTSKGESGDVEAGATATFDLNLDAGSYALVCNVEKHYAMGMRAPFVVT